MKAERKKQPSTPAFDAIYAAIERGETYLSHAIICSGGIQFNWPTVDRGTTVGLFLQDIGEQVKVISHLDPDPKQSYVRIVKGGWFQ